MKRTYGLGLIFVCFLSLFSFHVEGKEILRGPIPAEVVQVIDGDTLKVKAHIWLGQTLEIHVRLRGIDTPEHRAQCIQEKEKAMAAKHALIQIIHDKKLQLVNVQTGKYAGRVVADVHMETGKNVGKILIQKGLARTYDGKKRSSWCPQVKARS